jgi:hypothetical protein
MKTRRSPERLKKTKGKSGKKKKKKKENIELS